MNKLLELVKAFFECECEKHEQVVGGVFFLCTYAKIKIPLEVLPFGVENKLSTTHRRIKILIIFFIKTNLNPTLNI
jgi:hypothetical protein